MSTTERQSYAAHADGIKRVAMTALAHVQALELAFPNELYVHTMKADGQFWTVTVGVANAYDYKVEVDETTDEVVSFKRV